MYCSVFAYCVSRKNRIDLDTALTHNAAGLYANYSTDKWIIKVTLNKQIRFAHDLNQRGNLYNNNVTVWNGKRN